MTRIPSQNFEGLLGLQGPLINSYLSLIVDRIVMSNSPFGAESVPAECSAREPSQLARRAEPKAPTVSRRWRRGSRPELLAGTHVCIQYTVYIYVCMHKNIYIYIHVYVYVYVFRWMEGWLAGWLAGWMDGWMVGHIHTERERERECEIYTYAHIHKCVYTHMYVCVYVQILK